MSGYQPIYKHIWKDPDFQELCPDDKLLFLFLCTNESTTISGIYPLTSKTVANETGIGLETVTQRFNNGFYKNVVYDNENKLVFVRKLRKYKPGGNPDLIKKAILNEYQMYSTTFLWGEFIKEYPDFEGLLNSSLTVIKPFLTLTLTNNNRNSNKTRREGVKKGGRGKTAKEIWELALEQLKLQVSKPNYRTWLAETRGLGLKGNQFIVGVKNSFVSDYLSKNQQELVRKVLIDILDKDVQVSFEVEQRG